MKDRKKLRLWEECFYVHVCVFYTELLCVGPVCASVTMGICSFSGYPGFNEESLKKEEVTDLNFAIP